MNCQNCQILLFDHLYGLLDANEIAALEAHLASCPACAESRVETSRKQGLIARAAKSAFPGIKFQPPAAQPQPAKSNKTPAPGVSPILSFPASKENKNRGAAWRVAAILPWAVAAAVLIAIPSTVIPVLNIFHTAESAQRDAQTAKRDADNAVKEIESVQLAQTKSLRDAELQYTAAEQTRTNLIHKWMEEQKTTLQNAFTRKFSVDVLKPAAVTPGAPNDFVVVVNDRRDLWETSGKSMVAEIHAVDASDAVIYTQPLNIERTAERKHALRLPVSAWAKVKPNAELYLVVAQVDDKTQARTELQERIRLAGPVFTTLLVTDKAAYRPGERLFFRSLTLDRITFKPPTREQILKYELLQPDGRAAVSSMTGTTNLVRVSAEGNVAPVRGTNGRLIHGIGCGEFILPPELPDGDYVLRLTEGQHPNGFPATIPLPVTRVVKVRNGTADTYRKEIHFERESFASGETVEAWAELKLQDELVPNAVVAGVVAVADEVALADVDFAERTDASGRAKVRFRLPAELLNADVRLKVTFRTPLGGEEAVAQRVPVIGNRVIVEFFPESGDAIAGVPCKVYVRATTPAGQPVNFRGTITDGWQTLATVESFTDPNHPGANRGLASFTYTPELGTRVWLKLESPSAVHAPILPGVPVHNAAVALMGGPGAAALRTGFMLPPVKTDGVVMSVLDPVTAPGEPIRVKLYSVGQARTLIIGAYTRGRLSDTQKVMVEPERPEIVKLMAGTDSRGGVVRITAFEEVDEKQDMKAVAERLVFRKPGEVLNLAFNATPAAVTPTSAPPVAIAQPIAPQATTPQMVPANSPLNCAITATDEKGNPAAAILWAAVVNSAVAPGVKDRHLPTHFLLAGEVKKPDDLEYADFLLTSNPKAAEALDLLLGTQGWRRFAEQTAIPIAPVAPAVPGKQYFDLAAPPEVAKWKVECGQFATWTEPAPLRDHRELQRKFTPLYEAAVKALAESQAALESARADEASQKGAVQAAAGAESARRDADDKNNKATAAREPVRRFHANVWYGVAGLTALAFACGAVAFLRPAGRFPLGFSTLGSVALAAFLIVAANWGKEARLSANDASSENLTTARAEKSEVPLAQPNAGSETVAAPRVPVPESHVEFGALGSQTDAKTDPKGDKTASTGYGPPQAPQIPTGAVTPTAGPLVTSNAPPSFNAYPPPVIFGNSGRGEPKHAVGGMPTPPKIDSPPPTLVRPIAPQPVPTPAPAPSAHPDHGWEPNRSNGISGAELDRTLWSRKLSVLRSRAAAPTDSMRLADSVQKANDYAAKYALEGGFGGHAALPFAADGVIPNRERFKTRPPEVVGPKPGEAFTYQKVRVLPPQPPLVVREFAAPRPAPTSFTDAIDTPDTVLWQPVIILPADGKAVLNFHVGSAPGGYEVVIAGHTTDGRLGATRGMILVSQPKTAVPNMQATPGAPNGAIVPPVPAAPPPPPMR